AKKALKNSKTGESYGSVTLTIGVALYRPGEPLSSLVQRADEGLYLGKARGRNCVVSEEDLDALPLAEAS
ncbi:MAG: diguanylate cyclase, partial [Kiloniellales bacterium]|nr:diguanylate cyclase [Kiloniellales bacterium]